MAHKIANVLSNLEEKYYATVAKFAMSLKNGKIDGSDSIALATVDLLKKIVNEIDGGNPTELLAVVKTFGRLSDRLLPKEAIVGNMVRRVLRIIREENLAANKSETSTISEPSGDSLQRVVRAIRAARASVSGGDLHKDLREPIVEHIDEYRMELETSSENISSQATEHIHSNELILTHGASRSVERFLKRAAKDRTFHVILAEGVDCNESHQMAVNLAKSKIECTVIADCAIMAVMSRVNKVIIGTSSVLAGGGLRARAGAHNVALAANHYSVPVIVLAPLYKLCPIHLGSSEQNSSQNTLISPESILPYQTGAFIHETQIFNPMFDYVPPDLVTLFVTNLGGNSPSYIYRIISELYDPSDYQL